jgi:hypothetical protein
MRFYYESQAGDRITNPFEKDLDDFLKLLDGEHNSFASLNSEDGSYIQVGGGPADFTVEIRKVTGSDFRHLKAQRRSRSVDERSLRIGGAQVLVRSNQILDLETVQRAFRVFLSSTEMDGGLDWIDTTDMFE